MRAPERIETERLVLRKPVLADAEAIFSRYASDPAATRLMSWPTHGSVEHTRAFLAFSDAQWERWPAGPYLIESRETGELLGSTGLGFESAEAAETGYILAGDAWGFGYATEALGAMVSLAHGLGVRRLHACTHPANRASMRVLEKCGFKCEGSTASGPNFPNLSAGQPCESFSYSRILE